MQKLKVLYKQNLEEMTNYSNIQNTSKLNIHRQSVDMKEFLYFWITKFSLNSFSFKLLQ